jgi:hypothetical protein
MLIFTHKVFDDLATNWACNLKWPVLRYLSAAAATAKAAYGVPECRNQSRPLGSD